VPSNAGAQAPKRRDEDAAKHLLEALGIPAPRRRVCTTLDQARSAFRALEKPVVVKILAPEIQHKTELGGVHLDITNDAELEHALSRLAAIPLRAERRYLVEEMAPPGLELLVGAVRDASFGPAVTVGLGGVFAEALRDSVTRLAPLSVEAALEMIAELRAAELLSGFRGGPPLDRMAVAEALVKLGDLLWREPSISEFEVNPLRVYSRGVMALDALMI
jgi:acetyltransferase